MSPAGLIPAHRERLFKHYGIEFVVHVFEHADQNVGEKEFFFGRQEALVSVRFEHFVQAGAGVVSAAPA